MKEKKDTLKKICMDSRTEADKSDPSQHNSIPEFTKNESQNAIDRLKKGKAKDSNGIRAEQLKNCSDDTKEKIRTIFNEIVQQENFTPKSRRKIRIQVIFKEGDREDPGNYRPICSRILEQRCREWSVPLYISTIDFTKAFDSVTHSALWSSLRFMESSLHT